MSANLVRTDLTTAAGLIVTAKPNVSLSAKNRLLSFLLIAGVTLAVALFFALHGVWLVLPFAGLEIAVLGWAFHHLHCHARDFERITVDDNHVLVETLDYKRSHRTEFQRYWARLIVRTTPVTRRARLYLRSHGREVEIGRFMNDEERVQVARQMRACL